MLDTERVASIKPHHKRLDYDETLCQGGTTSYLLLTSRLSIVIELGFIDMSASSYCGSWLMASGTMK